MASSAAASTANSFTGTPPAVLSLATKDCRAKAIVYYAWPVSTSTDISTLYSGTASLSFYTAALGPAVDYGTATNDYAIGLVYNLGNLAASDSTVISYAYIYNGATGLDEAFPEPQMYVNGAAHDSTDTVTVCAATTLPVSLLHANDKNWTLSHWSWAPTTGLASDTGINNTINVGLLTGPVTYTITGTDSAMGACAQKVFTLRIIPIFIPNNVSNNGPLCAGSTLQLTETDTLAGVTTYNWVGPNGFTSTQHNPVITGAVYADSGLYTVTITNGPCSSPSSTNVIIYPTPALPVAASPTYCQFVPSVPLSATGTNLLWYTTATGGTGSTVAPTPSTAVAGVFTYYVSQTINGCEGPRLPVIVTVNAKPIPPVITDLPGSYCPGQPFNNFTVVTGTNILWYAGATGGVGSGVAPAVSTASPGTFTYWASQSVLGCESDRSSVSITVFPGVTAAFDTFIHHGCQTDSVDFINQSVNGVQYLWTFGDGSSSTAYSVTPHLYTSQGTYTVTLYAHSGDQCVDSAIKVLPLVHPIVASFTLDSAIVCQGHPVSFRDTSTATMPSYLWSFGDGATSTLKDPAHAYANTGTYNVVLSVTDEFLCSDNTAATVVVDSATVISMTISDTTLCLGNNITVAATFVAQGITAFVWNLGDGDSVVNVNPLTYAYPVTGSYVVTGMARYRACPDVAITRNVNIFAQPMIGLGADTSICEGSEAFSVGDYMNAANPAAHWLWSTGQVTPTITITSAGSYGVTVNIGGCIATDTINVINDCLLALPNIFTPNGDGTNDYFNPRDYMKGITSFDMTIYNRWGQQVFHTDAIQGSGWDGMFNNTPQPEGVYIYQLNATFKDSQRINKTGNFTLIR